MLNKLTKLIYYMKSYRLYLPQIPIVTGGVRVLNYNQGDFKNLNKVIAKIFRDADKQMVGGNYILYIYSVYTLKVY